MAVDTLQLSKDLQDVEFTRDQADALARILLEHTNGKIQEDLARLEQRLTEFLQSSLQDLQASMKRDFDELKRNFDELKRDFDGLKRDFDGLRVELKAEIKAGDASTKVDLVKWIVGTLVLNFMGTAGLMITLIRTIPH